MVSQSQNLWLEMDQIGEVTVVRFKIPWILKEGTIEAIGEALYGLTEGSSCRKIVLNFGNVKSLASTMFGKLTALHQRVKAGGGRLALCSIDPGLQEVFETVKLVGILPIYGNEQEAIQSL